MEPLPRRPFQFRLSRLLLLVTFAAVAIRLSSLGAQFVLLSIVFCSLVGAFAGARRRSLAIWMGGLGGAVGSSLSAFVYYLTFVDSSGTNTSHMHAGFVAAVLPCSVVGGFVAGIPIGIFVWILAEAHRETVLAQSVRSAIQRLRGY